MRHHQKMQPWIPARGAGVLMEMGRGPSTAHRRLEWVAGAERDKNNVCAAVKIK